MTSKERLKKAEEFKKDLLSRSEDWKKANPVLLGNVDKIITLLKEKVKAEK